MIMDDFAVANLNDKQPLSSAEVLEARKIFGYNVIETGKATAWYRILLSAFVHPFNVLLCILATASGAIGDYDTMGIMLTMVALSSAIRFNQEWKSHRAAQSLLSLISKKVTVIRKIDGNAGIQATEINAEDLVPGDWVKLGPGNLIAADLTVLTSKDLHISQATLTGEALPVEKYPSGKNSFSGVKKIDNSFGSNTWKSSTDVLVRSNEGNTTASRKLKTKRRRQFIKFLRNVVGLQTGLDTDPESQLREGQTKANLDRTDHLFMGTSVVTGVATAIVHATGSRTYFGMMADQIKSRRPQNAFQLGVRRISWIFFITMALLVPPVLLLQGFLNTNWADAVLFALSVAVGLTPEMLPMIVNTTLAKGAYEMSRRKCIVKDLDAVVNLGGMDILCTDKTGTLTKSIVTLMKHVDPIGESSLLVLNLAYLNSCFQSVNKNPMDTAVLLFYDSFYFQGSKAVDLESVDREIKGKFDKIDEIPFDFERRRITVVLKENVEGSGGDVILICKGAVEEILQVCTRIIVNSSTASSVNEHSIESSSEDIGVLTEETRAQLVQYNVMQSEDGLRILGVAYKKIPNFFANSTVDVSCENDLIFAGFIGFLDPPKESTADAIKNLISNNVTVKVLTGDSSVVCRKICEDIGLPVQNVVASSYLEGRTDEEVSDLAEQGTIFSKLTPIQKADIVRGLRRKGHIVGFLGDGINDSPALVEADVGISVDSATDIAKESADIILLEKNLGVVAEGVIFGRSTYGNTLKYIVMAVSSNFGNVFSMLVASSWLPFLPMLPIHVVVQNLLYDISQISIPWDHMDAEFLVVPHRWSMKSVLRFMVWVGPWSSVFDITTFLFMYYYFNIKTPDDNVTLFQTTWFTVGLLTQTLIVHMIRTPKIPFFQSTASYPVIVLTVLIMGAGIAIPFVPVFRKWLQMTRLEPMVYPYIVGALLSYAIAAQLAKIIYKRLFNEWF